MARYTGTVPSARTPDATFAYLAEFTSAAEWDPSVRKATRLDDGPVGVGSRFEITSHFAGRDITLVYEIVEHDPAARRVVLRAENGSTEGIDTITVADDATVTYDAKIEVDGLAGKLMDPALGLLFGRLGAKAKARMTEVLAA